MFCGGRELKTTTFFFFFWTLIQSFKIQLQKKLPTFDNEWDGISACRIFKSDVFVAVAVVAAYQLPIFTRVRVFKVALLRFFFSIQTWVWSLTFLHFKQVGITAFGKTQIHSKGEIFAAAAFAFAKAPYANSPSLSSLSALSTSETYQFRFPSVILYQFFGCNLGFAKGNIPQKNCKSVFVYFRRCRFWTRSDRGLLQDDCGNVYDVIHQTT